MTKQTKQAKPTKQTKQPGQTKQTKQQRGEIGRRQLATWMLQVTRPVLGALVVSTLCRIMDQILLITLYAFAGYQTLDIGLHALYGQAPSAKKIWMILLVMVLISLVKGFLRYAEQFYGHLVAFKALELLRREVYENLTPQAPAVMNETDSGDLLSKITSDIDRIEVFFAHTIAPAISALVVPLLFVIAVSTMAPVPLTLWILAVYIVALAIIPSIGNGEGGASADKVATAKGQVMQHVSDSIQGIEEVIGYGAVKRRMSDLRENEKEVLNSGRGYRFLLASRRALSQFLMLGAMLGIFTIGLNYVHIDYDSNVHTFTIATLGAITLAFMRSWEIIRGVEGFATYLANSFASARRIHQIAHGKPAVSSGEKVLTIDEGTTVEGPIVQWRDVTFTYPEVRGRSSARPSLSNVSIDVPAGGWVCIVGATGSGKTTLISLLERYWDPQEGDIIVAGHNVKDYDIDSLRHEIAVVSQRTHIFAGSIAHNLRLAAPKASDKELIEALRLACLDEVIAQLPDGLDTVIGSGGAGLSGGQTQRLSLARAYLMDADIFVLDEFTAHLDPQLAMKVRQRLREHKPHATVIEITHGLDMVNDADWVAVIDSGSVIEQDRPDVLLGDKSSTLSRLAERL